MSFIKTKDQKNTTHFAELLDQYEYPEPKQGDILEGTILHFNDNELFVDVGAKRTAVVPQTELNNLDDTHTENFSVGDEIKVYVAQTPRGNESLIVSVEKILVEKDWDEAEKYLASQEVIELKIIGYNKGGLLVEFGRIRGFIPNSKHPAISNGASQSQKHSFVGQTIAVQVMTLDRQADRLVFTAEKAFSEQVEKAWDALEIGSVVKGRVSALKNYGAFVDLGLLTGLLHISNISHEDIKHPRQSLSIGDEIKVVIDSVDRDKERISLDRKSLLPNPYSTFINDHNVGDLVTGVVQNATDFGLFIGLEGGVVGLLHMSEMVMVPGSHPSEVAEEGEELLVSILDLQADKQRISLSQSKVDHDAQIKWMMEQAEA